MNNKQDLPFQIANTDGGMWKEHPRFSGILMKTMLTSADNPHASVNIVKVPPQGIIGHHTHLSQVETVYVLKGESILNLQDEEIPFAEGQIIAIPVGLVHALRNIGKETVELLTFFTPPIT